MSAPLPTATSWAEYARGVIEQTLRHGEVRHITPPRGEPPRSGGAFVTLRRSRRLRGCMGTVECGRPVAEAVRDAAISAALHDPRFSPVTLAELTELTIVVSLLSPPEPMTSLEQLEIGRHGVIVRRGDQRGLFLPEVAVEHGLDREAFVTRCCVEKAGLPADAWRDPQTEVLLFTTQIFSEEQPSQ